jgi:hypothetical protein
MNMKKILPNIILLVLLISVVNASATITKTLLNDPVTVGDIAQFMINVTNTGAISLDELSILDTFNGSMLSYSSYSINYIPHSTEHNFYNMSDDPYEVLEWNITLDVGHSMIILVNFTTLQVGETFNFVDVGFNENPPFDNSTVVFTIDSDVVAPVINDIWVLEDDNFYSNHSGNDVINIIANVSGTIDYGQGYILYANFSEMDADCGSGGDGIIHNMTPQESGDGWALYNATCPVGHLTDNEDFEGYPVSVVAINAAGFDVNHTEVVLYNMTTPPQHGEDPCWALGEETTDFSKELNFNDVNFIYELQLNGSEGCYYGDSGLPWGNTLKHVITLNFSSVDFTDNETIEMFGQMQDVINVSVKGPGQHGASIVDVNTTAFNALNTSTTITIFGLPFSRPPEIAGSQGISDISYVYVPNSPEYSGFPQGNLTFTVAGFSGYIIDDLEDPIIDIQTPNTGDYSTAPEYINFTLNATGTQISYTELLLNGIRIWNQTNEEIYNETFTDCYNVTESFEFVQCNVSLAGNITSEGEYNLTIIAFDFGGDAPGNNASASVLVNYTNVTINSFCGGTGTEIDPYLICTAHDLNTTRDYLDAHFKLNNDIDLNVAPYNEGNGWEPIGDYGNSFEGHFDGNGFEIRDLFINRPDANLGLFGVVGSDALIENVGVVDVSISGEEYVGTLVGENLGTIKDSYSTGNINCISDYCGGFVGQNYNGYIYNSYAVVDVSGDDTIGGFVGYNWGYIYDSYAMGDVSGSSGYVGGFVGGHYRHNISNSYSIGSVSGVGSDIGGFAGSSSGGIINDSFYNFETSGMSDSGKGEPKTTSEMKNINTFFSAGWDLNSVWGINASENSGYPFLQWQGYGSEEPMFAGGVGTSEDPFEIVNCQQLQNMKENLSASYILIDDVDCEDTINWNSGAGFEPIGNEITFFTGNFDGNQYNISNLFINRSGTDFVGLFGEFRGDVLDLGLINVDIVGSNFVGAFSGQIYQGFVNNVYVTGTVEGSQNIGGLVGFNTVSLINNSYSTGNIIGTNQQVGGLVGLNSGGDIFNSYSTANVSSNDDRVGGLVGANSDSGLIYHSYATGNVSGDYGVGGFVGYNSGGSIINNSYAIGNVFGEYDYIGGLVGENVGSQIINSYSIGFVEGDRDVGGLVGITSGGTTSNSYYDTETSGQNDTGKGIPKTTAQMKTESTFSDWNITTTTTDLNNGYPYLAWQNDVDSPIWLVYKQSSTPPSSSGGSSSSITTNLFNVNDDELKKGYSRSLFSGDRLRFNVGRFIHHLTVNYVRSNSAKITVSSTPQSRIMNVGEDWKVDVNNDGYYDIIITLEKIVGTRTEIEVKSINEKISTTEEVILIVEEEEKKEPIIQEESEQPIVDDEVIEPVITDKKIEEPDKAESKTGLIILAVIILAIIAVIVIKKIKTKA